MNNDTCILYHAGNIGKLQEILPLSGGRGSHEKVCYFTSNKTYALFYLRDMEINHVTCGIDKNGVVVYDEQFPNQLAILYRGRSGYIYSCLNDSFITQGHVGGVWVSTQSVPVFQDEYISDVYGEILKAVQSGAVRINWYEGLSNEKKAEFTERMKQYILDEGILGATTLKSRFFRKHFPASWKAAELMMGISLM